MNQSLLRFFKLFWRKLHFILAIQYQSKGFQNHYHRVFLFTSCILALAGNDRLIALALIFVDFIVFRDHIMHSQGESLSKRMKGERASTFPQELILVMLYCNRQQRKVQGHLRLVSSVFSRDPLNCPFGRVFCHLDTFVWDRKSSKMP